MDLCNRNSVSFDGCDGNPYMTGRSHSPKPSGNMCNEPRSSIVGHGYGRTFCLPFFAVFFTDCMSPRGIVYCIHDPTVIPGRRLCLPPGIHSRSLCPDPSHQAASQQTQNMCITFEQWRTNVEDVGTTLYKCYTNVLCLLGSPYLSVLHYRLTAKSCVPL